ncbi:MAG: NADPH-dependent FMN reductase, partial [Candidatus Kariarchaeaceae archaeon]
KISKLLVNAQGLIIGSPEYHGSYSGVLKNLLDLLGFKEFEGKMIGLVGISGGSLGAANTLNGLRTIGRQLHGWVLPGQVSIPRASSAFEDNGQLIDKKLEERLKDVGRNVAKFSYLHHNQKSLEFLQAWEQAPSNPGGSH